MPFLTWTAITIWVAAFVLQCARVAVKHDPRRDRLYRTLTTATFAAVIAGCVLHAALAVAGGGKDNEFAHRQSPIK